MPEDERSGPRHRDRPDTNTPAEILTPDELLVWIDAYLRGWERGYASRVNEENADWPPAKVRVLGRWFDQAEQRRKWDAAVRAEVAAS